MSPARILAGTWQRALGTVLLGPFCAACTCAFGMPLMALVDWLLRGQLAHALGRPVEVEFGPRRLGGAVLILLGFAASAAATLCGNGIAYRTLGESAPALFACTLPLTFLLGVVTWPLAFVPLVALDSRQVEGRVLVTAMEVAGQVPRTVRALLTLSWCWVFPAIDALVALEPQGAFIALLFLPGLVLPFVSSGFVSVYVETVKTVSATEDLPIARLPAYVQTLAGTAVLASALLVAALGYAAATPSPLRSRGIDPDRELTAEPVRIEGTSLTVSPDPRGLRVEADDGGGVGLIPGGRTDRVAYERRGDDFLVVGRGGFSDRSALVDAQGVRLQDPISARLSARMTLPVGVLLCLVVLAFGFVFARAPTLQRAMVLRDYAGADDRVAVGDRRLLEATVRTEAPPKVEGGRVSPTAPVELIGRDLRLLVPDEGVPLFGPYALFGSGAQVCLVGRFETLSPAARRESRVPWPADAFLVVGSRVDAVDLAMRRVAKGMALALLVGSIAAAAAALFVALSG